MRRLEMSEPGVHASGSGVRAPAARSACPAPPPHLPSMPRADNALPWLRWTDRVGRAAVPAPPLSLTALSLS
eukprot:7446909-Lingulodinium_polyedra.AAC.1